MNMCPHLIVGTRNLKKLGFLGCNELPKVKVQENLIDEELAYLKHQFVIFCLNYMLFFENTNPFMFWVLCRWWCFATKCMYCKVNNKYKWILYFYLSLSQNILKVWYFTKLEHPKYEEGFKRSHKTMKYYCKCVNMFKTKWFRKIAQKNLNKVLNYYHCCFMKFCVTSFKKFYI